MTRQELEALRDQLYVLEAAIEDVERDLTKSSTRRDLEDALSWVLDAARPLFTLRFGEASATDASTRGTGEEPSAE